MWFINYYHFLVFLNALCSRLRRASSVCINLPSHPQVLSVRPRLKTIVVRYPLPHLVPVLLTGVGDIYMVGRPLVVGFIPVRFV